MKKTIFALMLLFAFVLTGCNGTKITLDEGKKDAANDDSSWLVLVYACGDMGGRTSDMITSLTQTRYPENINVVVQTGGSQNWKLGEINGDYIQRYVMQKGSAHLKDQKQGASMGSYETLSAFINWGMETFPSDKYMLFVLGDGNGVEVCKDENFGGDSLDIEEIYYTLSMAPNMLDVICFDAPQMASLEMASALPNYAKYMLASEENFSGFDYGALLDCIMEYPMATPQDVCKEMCEVYAKACEESNTTQLAQVSLLDLSQISQLNQVFDALSLKINSFTHNLEDAGTIVRLLENTQRSVGSDMVDLGSFATALSGIFPEASAELTNAINTAVVCNTKGTLRQSSGISVCYPRHDTIAKTYLKSTISDYYKQFLKNVMPKFTSADGFINEGAEQTGAYQEYANTPFSLETNSHEGTFSAIINGEISPLKSMVAKRYVKKGSTLISCGEIAELDCYWSEKRYETYLKPKVATLKGVVLDIQLASRFDDFSIYTADILLDDKNAQIYLAYSVSKQEYTYLGVWCEGNFKKSGDGEKITVIAKDKNTQNTIYQEKLDFSGELSIKTQALPSGNYYIEFEATDIFRNIHKSRGLDFNA